MSYERFTPDRSTDDSTATVAVPPLIWTTGVYYAALAVVGVVVAILSVFVGLYLGILVGELVGGVVTFGVSLLLFAAAPTVARLLARRLVVDGQRTVAAATRREESPLPATRLGTVRDR